MQKSIFKMGLIMFTLFAFAAVSMISSTAVASDMSTWDAIKKRGSLRIAGINTPPYWTKNPSTGEWGGLGTYIGKAMAEALGVELDIVEVTWGTSIPALQANKIDIMFFLDSTPARSKAVAFPTVSVVDIPLAVLHSEKIKVENWTDLNASNITVAVPQGTAQDAYISKRLTKADILRFPSNAESVAAFQSGRANSVAMFLPALVLLQKKIGRGTITLPKPEHAASSCAAVRYEENKRFFEWVSSSLFYWYNTGTIDEWFKKTLEEIGINPDEIPGVYKAKW